MGMTPDQFFIGFVQGNYDDYSQHPESIRRAFNAAVSASHMADHYFTYYREHEPDKIKSFSKIGDFVEYLSRETNECFRDIRSISNAYKHLYTSADPQKGKHSSVSSTGAIETVTIDDFDSDLKQLEEGFIDEVDETQNASKVIFTRKDDKRAEFLPVIKEVMEFWNDFLMK